MALPPSLFQELEDVPVLLMTKRDRVGRNFSYSLADPNKSIVYTVVEEELSKFCLDDRRLPVKVKMMYEGQEVMTMVRLPAASTCFNLCPYSKIFQVCAPAENVIGHVRRISGYNILDENNEKIFRIVKVQDSLFGPVPMNVKRLSDEEVVAHIGRRWMLEPLGEIPPTPLQRWGTRYLIPLSLKERVLVLAATLVVDYCEFSVDPAGQGSMVGHRRLAGKPWIRY